MIPKGFLTLIKLQNKDYSIAIFFNFDVKWTTMDLQTRKIADSINGRVIEHNDLLAEIKEWD